MWVLLLSVLFWLLAGFVGAIWMTATDVRGIEYDSDYFDKFFYTIFVLVIALGFISLVFMGISSLIRYEVINKSIYKLANIGVKKNRKNE